MGVQIRDFVSKRETMTPNDTKAANLLILEKLSHYLATNPDMRYRQALINLGLIKTDKDPFYEKSGEALKRMLEALESLQSNKD